MGSFDGMIQKMSGAIFSRICSFLPWDFCDPKNNTYIQVKKLENGSLQIYVVDREDLSSGITVEVSDEEIQRLLAR